MKLPKIFISSGVMAVVATGALMVAVLNNHDSTVRLVSPTADISEIVPAGDADNPEAVPQDSTSNPPEGTTTGSGTQTGETSDPGTTTTETPPAASQPPYVVNTEKRNTTENGFVSTTCYYSWSDGSTTSKFAGSAPVTPDTVGNFSCPDA
jgi:hypothetical protein